MRKIIFYPMIVLAVGLLIACGSDSKFPTGSDSLSDSESTSSAKRSFMQEYEITIENLTPATGPGARRPFALYWTHKTGPSYQVIKQQKWRCPIATEQT